MKVGLISDTHDVLHPHVLELLKGCQLILHCGDITKPTLLNQFEGLAPVIAVRGNNDSIKLWPQLLDIRSIELEGLTLAISHYKEKLIDVQADVKCFGHSHIYTQFQQEETWWINPGSCGRKRFNYPLTLAILTLQDKKVNIEKIDLSST